LHSPSGHIHIHCGPRKIKQLQLIRQLGSMSRLNPSLASGLEELLDAGMPEALDHVIRVA
jgi:hypothetical protein